MPSEEIIPFSSGRARVVALPELFGHEAWAKALAARAKDHRFYEIVERTLASGFEHFYIILEDERGEVRAVQPIFFVQQNLVEGVPALRAVVDSVRRVFPRFLTMLLLMVGCAAGEGHLGVCRAEDEAWAAAALGSSLRIYARRKKASLIVFKDFRSTYREPLRPLREHGFTRIPSMPMTRLALPFRDFEDYLGSLSKATRKDLRRKFRKAEKLEPLVLEVVTDVSPVVDEIHSLYLQVQSRSKLKFETLTKEYFCSLGKDMPDRVRFFLWRQNGRIVAFSLCLVHDGTIYDDYLGLDYNVALDLHLYFLSFRDIIRWAIENGIGRYLSSPLNYEPKLHLGCELLPLDLYVMHTSPILNRIFPPLLKFLEPTRHDKVLQRFPNAADLH